MAREAFLKEVKTEQSIGKEKSKSKTQCQEMGI